MGRIGKIARRTFLLGSAAVVAGVANGYYRYKKDIPNPLLDELATGEAAITPYVMIDAKGVTLITPRAERQRGCTHRARLDRNFHAPDRLSDHRRLVYCAGRI